MIMEPTSSSGAGSPEHSWDFSFGFNDINFSDRILAIEIIDQPENVPHPDGNCSHWSRNGKRRRDDLLNNAVGREAAWANEASPGMDSLPVRVKTIYVNSLILAAKSTFFRKLFSNGIESAQKPVTLRIKASEEVSFMDLLNYMYSNNLSAPTSFALLNMLITADKFEVASCLSYCSRLLQNSPMTCESALFYLDLPSSLLMPHAIQPLIDAAKQFLAAHFKDVDSVKEEVLNLPLSGIEAVLSSDSLQVASECVVYDLMLLWARKHYPKLEERRVILKMHLLRLIRFPFMSCSKLKEVLTCGDIDPAHASKIVLDALFFKAEAPHRQRYLAAQESLATFHQFVERAYKLRPVKVIEFELPRQHCTIYLDLKLDEVTHIFPDGQITSEAFHLGGQEVFLIGKCILDEQTQVYYFGLVLIMNVAGSESYTVDYEVASRTKPSEEFVSKWRGSHAFTGGPGRYLGNRNVFGVPWTDLIAYGSSYFINGILHLRACLTMKK